MDVLKSAFIASLMIGVIGCSSSASTVFTRNESNSGWSLVKRVKGIPITVKIPTHVKLYVYEKIFLQEVKAIGDVTEIREIELRVPVRDFAQDFIYSEKIMMVDFKRPAAGAFNLEVDLTEDQYIEKIQHDVTDETIQRVTELVGTLAPDGLLGRLASKDDPGGMIDPKIKEVKSVVAVGVFEIDAPDFELQIAEFLECHLNKSHDAWVTPPWISEINRPYVNRTDVGPDLCPNNECLPFGSVNFSDVHSEPPGDVQLTGDKNYASVPPVPSPRLLQDTD